MAQVKIRYFVEQLPAHEDPHHESQKSAMHDHCREHHWLRIDANTIVGIGHFRNSTSLQHAREHSTVVVLPHLHDATPVKSLLSAEQHTSLKQRFGLSDSDSTSDFIGKMIANGHLQFEPPI